MRRAETRAYTIINQDVYDQFPNGLPQQHDQFPQSFENYTQYNPQQSFPGPPTPPNQHSAGLAAQHGLPIGDVNADILTSAKTEPSDQSRRQGSNSDDEDMTPAQSRRKAQNRAAYVSLFCTSLLPTGPPRFPGAILFQSLRPYKPLAVWHPSPTQLC